MPNEPINESLRAFARQVMACWPDYNLDDLALQEIAIRHGLLTPENRTTPCGNFNDCYCAQFFADCEMEDGFVCYRKAGWLHEDPSAAHAVHSSSNTTES